MLPNPNFNKYSLVLITEEKNIIFTSKKTGLRPLFEVIKKYKGNITNCLLYDKIIGLAAARLVSYSGFITSVYTPLCSKDARDFLIANNIPIQSEKIVEKILNKDKTQSCPMEEKARLVKDNEDFFNYLSLLFSSSPSI